MVTGGASAPAFLTALAAYVSAKVQPWHTPGHKQGRGAPSELLAILGPALAHDLSDVLEDATTDNSWEQCLQQAEAAAAQAFGAGWTRFLVNGSSGGLHAAFLGLCKEGDTVLVPRAAHMSVAASLTLCGARPVYLAARLHSDIGVPLPAASADYEAAISTHHPKVVFVTSPNYYGISADLSAIAELAHAHQALLLVDEAHGAHYAFHPSFPPPALAAGADVTVQSAHKTLSALTPAALLHVRSGMDTEPFSKALQIVGTTSPSSLTLASLDAARAQMAMHGVALWQQAIDLAEEIRRRINKMAGWHCLGADELDATGLRWDPCRLIFRHVGASGLAVAAALRHRHGIQVEMADSRWVVALCGLGDSGVEAERLLAALASPGWADLPFETPQIYNLPEPRVMLTPRQALQYSTQRIPWNRAQGRIAAEVVCPYPPGAPVLAPGEEITSEVLHYLSWAKAAGFSIHGERGDGCVVVIEKAAGVGI